MNELLADSIFPIILLAVMISLWFLLRSKATPVSPEASPGGGQPAVMEFFSNA